MRILRLFIAVLAIAALAGCARLADRPVTSGNSAGASAAVATPVAPSQSTATALAETDVHAFLDPEAVSQMSEQERSEAASAQFYALQFGRPGAPRPWSGDTNASGTVTVGPYVRVNSRDCREFEHKVTIGATVYERSGTACREDSEGGWSVVSVAT